jgi:NACHT domain
MAEEYVKSGSAGIIGTQYEIRLLLHFMVKALVNGYHSFHLACNMTAAGKFDDVVFRYEKVNNGVEELRLLQAKNKKNNTEKKNTKKKNKKKKSAFITRKDFLEEHGDFGLKKYYNSYRKEIGNSVKFEGMKDEGKVKDVILFTPKDVHKNLLSLPRPSILFEDNPNINLTLEDYLFEDDILTFQNSKHDPKNKDVQSSKSHYKFETTATNQSEDQKNFFDHFILAVNQPDENQLMEITQQQFHVLVPFSKEEFSDIYLKLEKKVTDWYKKENEEGKGTWLTKDEAMKWVSEATGQDFPLINPLKEEWRKKIDSEAAAEAACDHTSLSKGLGKENEVKENKIDWDDLNETARDYIGKLTVNFQGQYEQLKDLVAKKAEREVMNKTLELIIENKIQIGKPEGDSDKNVKFLFQNDTKIRFGKAIVNSANYHEKYYIPRTVLWPKLRSENDRRNQAVSVFKTRKEFDELTGNAVLVNKNTGIVLQFKGSLDAINEVVERGDMLHSRPKHYAKRAESNSDESKKGLEWFSENDLLEEVRGVAIISDTAGMGKSTILRRFCHLIKSGKPSTWVLRMELNEPKVTAKIEKLNDTMDDNTALDFFKFFATATENDLEKELLHQRLEGNGEIVIMFDGFDEISDEHQMKMVSLLKTLMKCAKIHQLWISTRPNAKKILEETTRKLAFGLQPFSHKNQVQFLTDYWLSSKNEHRKSREEYELFAKELLDVLSKNLRDNEREFTGIPLQCRLLAEAFIGESSLPDHLNLSELYDKFWKKKWKFFIRKSLIMINEIVISRKI